MTTINISATDCGGTALSGSASFRLKVPYHVSGGRIGTNKNVQVELDDDGAGTVDLDAGVYDVVLPGRVTFVITVPDSATAYDLQDLISSDPYAAPTGVMILGDDGNTYRVRVIVVDGQLTLTQPELVT